jgi:anti-sigma regulatory factor (Ser/Thr protein kinase)
VEAYARFRHTTDQVSAARAFVQDTLMHWGEAAAVSDAVLVTSELFTNAVLHGTGWVDVHLRLDPDAVRIAVVDDGRERPAMVPGPLPTTTLTGRGLHIVDAVTAEWGDTRDQAGRTRVWAEVPR